MEKPVSAAIANRRFSKLLSAVHGGHSYLVTAPGKPVAKIVPVAGNGAFTRVARAALLKRLRSEPVATIGRWTRNELYADKL